MVQFYYLKGNNMPILNKWIFQSMTTITKAQGENITTVYEDGNDIETLSFDDSGEIIYNIINDRVKKTGRSVWYADQSYVSMVVDLDTTFGTYGIESSFLTIIPSEKESDE
tara:strand:+ start:980 stop:1312 length:333 start_codon:yes stop_codon:yes gene_type:complete